MFDTKIIINEQCNRIHCTKKQHVCAQHEPKQQYLLCSGNIHLWFQDIMETSVQFDGYQNNINLQIVLSKQNNQCLERQVILSTIQCKTTESLPQAVNDKTTNIREHTCKAKWDELQSRDTVSNKYHQHLIIKGTHHEQSTRKINR